MDRDRFNSRSPVAKEWETAKWKSHVQLNLSFQLFEVADLDIGISSQPMHAPTLTSNTDLNPLRFFHAAIDHTMHIPQHPRTTALCGDTHQISTTPVRLAEPYLP